MSRKAPLLFTELQSFKQPRVRFLLAILPVMLSLLLIWQVGLRHAPSKSGLSNGEVIGWTAFIWLIYLRLITVKLRTRVFPDTLFVSLKGMWTLRKIPLAQIRRVETITYNARRDYRGYGIRSNGRDRAYIAQGDGAVRLTLGKAAPVVLGTQNPRELANALTSRAIPEIQ